MSRLTRRSQDGAICGREINLKDVDGRYNQLMDEYGRRHRQARRLSHLRGGPDRWRPAAPAVGNVGATLPLVGEGHTKLPPVLPRSLPCPAGLTQPPSGALLFEADLLANGFGQILEYLLNCS